jgi:hypothetical protein
MQVGGEILLRLRRQLARLPTLSTSALLAALKHARFGQLLHPCVKILYAPALARPECSRGRSCC